MDKLLTCKEVAERHQVKVITVQGWIRTKKLHAMKTGKVWRIHPKDLEAFEEKCRTRKPYRKTAR